MNERAGSFDRVRARSSRILQPVSAAWGDDRVSTVLGGAALIVLIAALLVAPSRLAHAMVITTKPFLEVGAIVTAGWLAVRLGAIETLTSSWRRWGRATNVVLVLVLCAVLSAFLNLDVAVGIAVPVALFAAADVGLDAGLLVIAVANVANATSFLLPTSNLTNLLVMGSTQSVPAGQYLASTWLAWLFVTGVTLGVLVPLVLRRAPVTRARTIAVDWSLPRIAVDLVAMFLIASGLRAIWATGITLPGGFALQTVAGSVLASAADNLPSAAVVHGGVGLGPWTAILAMSVGANLFLIGSVATVISRRLATESGARFSLATFTLIGAVLLPVQLGAAYIGLRATGAIA
jgi:arsenical pump membrane protein